jgi:hypothetical protein
MIWTGEESDKIGRTPSGGGQMRVAGDHPAGSGGGRNASDGTRCGPVLGYCAAQFYPTRYTSAARPLVLEPPKKSTTKSPGSVSNSMKKAGSFSGNRAGWPGKPSALQVRR